MSSRSWIEKEVNTRLFAFSSPLMDDKLKLSIAEIGIVQPLIIRGAEDGFPPILLCGHRRLEASPSLTQIPAILLEAKQIPLRKAFRLVLSENLSFRKFNLVEIGNVLQIGLECLRLSKDEIIQEFFPVLGLEQNEKVFLSHLEILRLPVSCLHFIVQHDLPLKTCLRLARMPEEALEIFFPILTHFSLGVNRTDEFLNHLQMIGKREEKSMTEVLEEILVLPEISLLLASHQDLNQQAEVLRRVLKKRCHPILGEMEETFSRESKSLHLPSSVSLKPPSYFEGDRFDVQFKFGSRDELKHIAQKLLDSAETSSLDKMLDLL